MIHISKMKHVSWWQQANGAISRGCLQHNLVNLPKTQVYPPCLELETWLMKNRIGVIQNFTIPKNSLKNKHQCGKILRI
jgi:hypothetical protein